MRKSVTALAVLTAVAATLVLTSTVPADSSTQAADGDFRFNETGTELGINYTAAPYKSPTGAAGVYVSDFDRNGLPDLLMLGGTTRTSEYGAHLESHPILYRNTGDGFEAAQLPYDTLDKYTIVGAAFLDYDNDNWEDLLLLPRNDEPVFLENQNGSFAVTDVGLDTTLSVPIGAATADYDGDGCLDLFVYQNGNWQENSPKGLTYALSEGHSGARAPEDDNGNANLLYRGTCSDFQRVNDSGLEGTHWSLGASFTDFTGDGLPDLHVTNDYNHDYLYVNDGNGPFEATRLGNATNRNGMSSEIADVNRDGTADIFVTNIYFDTSNLTTAQQNYIENRLGKRMQGNNLMINRGNGTFDDRASDYNVRKGGWGWAASIGDFDNDGDRDLFHGTEKLKGFWENTTETTHAIYPVFRERTDEGFVKRDPRELGFESADARGVARLDYDRDGRLDLAIAMYANQQYPVYHNEGAGGNFFEARVLSRPSQTAIGSDVYLTVDNETYHRTYRAQTDFLSQESRVLHFGLGEADAVESVRVVWPDGTETTVTDVDVNTRVTISPNDVEQIESPATSQSTELGSLNFNDELTVVPVVALTILALGIVWHRFR
jgi:hypothetical protein